MTTGTEKERLALATEALGGLQGVYTTAPAHQLTGQEGDEQSSRSFAQNALPEIQVTPAGTEMRFR